MEQSLICWRARRVDFRSGGACHDTVALRLSTRWEEGIDHAKHL